MWAKPILDKPSTFQVKHIMISRHRPELTSNNDDNDKTPRPTIERVFPASNNSTYLYSIPNIAFLAPDDILVLQDLDGTVWRILNGKLLKEPLIDLNSHIPDGLIGIATAKNQNGSTHVFSYLDEALNESAIDINGRQLDFKSNNKLAPDREGDRLCRFKLIANRLVEPKLLFSIPDKTTDTSDEYHHDGKVVIGPDNAV